MSIDKYEKVKRFCEDNPIGEMVKNTHTKNGVTDWAKVAEKLNIKLDERKN